MKIRAISLCFAILFSFSCNGGGNSGGGAPNIAWSSCGAQGAECAKLYVPLDHSSEDGTEISLALVRFPASGEKKGSVFMNPGGPGGSAVEFVEYFAETLIGRRLRENFDLVAFDPRGVGQSTEVRCVDNPVPYVAINKSPENAVEYNQLIETVQAYTAQCAERSGALLEHVSTMDVVRDMELIRRALGEGKLNYIGLSYGTKIGALYADEYPQNVRAMVLDGMVPPSLTPLEFTLEQTGGFERSLQAFLTSCAENSSCAFGGGNPGSALSSLMADLKRQPLTTGDGRVLGYGEAFYGVTLALYSDSLWPRLEEALAAASSGEGGPLLGLSDYYFERSDDGTYTNITDAYYAVNCADGSPLSLAEINAYAEEAALSYPFFGASMMYDNLYCTFWPARPGMEPKVVTAKGAPQIMVVGTTGDPATPYAWSQRLVSELASSFLVTFHGEVHVAIGLSSCVDDLYEQYLLHPEAQFSDADCAKDTAIKARKTLDLEPPRIIRRW